MELKCKECGCDEIVVTDILLPVNVKYINGKPEGFEDWFNGEYIQEHACSEYRTLKAYCDNCGHEFTVNVKDLNMNII